jgi:hypothetical protein
MATNIVIFPDRSIVRALITSFTNLLPHFDHVQGVLSLLFTIFDICDGTSTGAAGDSSVFSHTIISFSFL